MKKKSLGLVVAAGLLVLLVANAVFRGVFPSAGVDVTADRLFSISGGTKQVLKELKEPVTARFYFSSQLAQQAPFYAAYAGRVKDMLTEYQRLAGGKMRLAVLDPKPFSDIEDEALAAGLNGARLNSAGEKVYFGLVITNATEGKEVIAFFQPEREAYLEYDITKAIHNVSQTTKQKIGLLSTLPVEGGVEELMMMGMGGNLPDPWAFVQQLKQQFDVVSVDKTAAVIPDGLAMLLVVQPDGLPESSLYALDQYVVKGGNALVFTDIMVEGNNPPAEDAAPATWNRIMNQWGVERRPDVFAADYIYGRRVSVPVQGREADIQYLPWLALDDKAVNPDDLLTADIQTLNMGTASILESVKDTRMKVQTLFHTSKESAAMNLDYVQGQPNPVEILKAFAPTKKEFALAVRSSGVVSSAFDKAITPPAPEVKEGEKASSPPPLPAFVAKGSKEVNLVIVGDTDMLRDGSWLQVGDFMGQKVGVPTANNGSFVLNAVDNLMGSNALISLRSRGISARPMTVLQNIQRDAESRFREEEEQLSAEVATTESKLNEMTQKSDPTKDTILTPEQEKLILEYQQQLVSARQRLRQVQRSLREDIESVQNKAIFVNTILVPLLVVLAGIFLARKRRRRVVTL